MAASLPTRCGRCPGALRLWLRHAHPGRGPLWRRAGGYGGIGFLLEGAESTPENRATGIIQKGRYTLEKGPAPGTYRVQIYWHKKTGRKIGPPDQATDERKQAIPPKYNEKTELKVEIKPGRNPLDFDLPAVPGRVESAAPGRKPSTPDR